jgi:hypothetical protein
LPAKLEAGQESTKNNSLHVKGNFKSAGVAASGLFSSFVLKFVLFVAENFHHIR